MKAFFSLLLMFVCLGLKAQFDINAYLGKPTTDLEIRLIQEQQNFVQNTNFNSPIIREVEMRLRAPTMGDSPDDFRFRISPINPWESKANRNYTDVLNNQLNTQWQVTYSQVLNRRYQWLIRLNYLEDMIAFLSNQNAQYKGMKENYSSQEGTARELLKLQKDILFNDIELDNLKGEKEKLSFIMVRGYGTIETPSLLNIDFVTPEQISLEIIDADEQEMNVFVQNEMNLLQLKESEWKISKSESFSNMGFLQAEYRSDRGDGISENLGWQVGFQLPIFNKDKPDLQRRKLDLLKDNQEVVKKKEEMDLKLFEYETELTKLLRSYQRIDSASAAIQISNVQMDLSMLLEFDEFKFRLEREKIELNRQIFSNYIYWLQMKGQLISDPLVNHLTSNKVRINVQMD